MVTERRAPPADRLRRIWHVSERIATHPGLSRLELSRIFHVSERQIQADLNVIRSTMGMPLVRRQGYRFAGEGPESAGGGLTLHDAEVLVMMLAAANRDPSIPKDKLAALSSKLAGVFPVHLQPVLSAVLHALDSRRQNTEQRVLTAILNAILRGSWVQLDHLPDGRKPILRPEILLPFCGYWYVLGEPYKPHRNQAVNLSTIYDVTFMRPEQTKVLRPVVNHAG